MRSVLIRLNRGGILLGMMLLAGCASSLRPPFLFNEILVHNKTGLMLKQVKIRDVERNRVFECDNVAPHGICSNRFRPQPYRGNPIEISWRTGNETQQTQNFAAKVPDFYDPGRPVRGVLVIGKSGGPEAFFEQEADSKD